MIGSYVQYCLFGNDVNVLESGALVRVPRVLT